MTGQPPNLAAEMKQHAGQVLRAPLASASVHFLGQESHLDQPLPHQELPYPLLRRLLLMGTHSLATPSLGLQ